MRNGKEVGEESGSMCHAEERAHSTTGVMKYHGPAGLLGNSERLKEKVKGRKKDKG